jgi:hypothetical protein
LIGSIGSIDDTRFQPAGLFSLVCNGDSQERSEACFAGLSCLLFLLG